MHHVPRIGPRTKPCYCQRPRRLRGAAVGINLVKSWGRGVVPVRCISAPARYRLGTGPRTNRIPLHHPLTVLEPAAYRTAVPWTRILIQIFRFR